MGFTGGGGMGFGQGQGGGYENQNQIGGFGSGLGNTGDSSFKVFAPKYVSASHFREVTS